MVECVTLWFISSARHLEASVQPALCHVLHGSWTHPKAQPVPWESSQFGPIRTWSGHCDSDVPWWAWGGWGADSILGIEVDAAG